jgi:hypothetical protein
MAKKKITKKEKVYVLGVDEKPVYAPFNFTGKDDTRIVNAMIELQATEGWACLVQQLQVQIDLCRTQIMEKKDIDGKPLNEAQMDELRAKANIYKELTEKPKKLAASGMHQYPEVRRSYDPYAREKTP